MEKTADTLVMSIVLTRPAIDFMESVSLGVKVGIMDKNVSKVSIHAYATENCLLFIFREYSFPIYIIYLMYIKF